MHALFFALSAAIAAPPSWEQTLERVAPAVVSIEVTATRDFDTEDASSSYGTGFVVDAELGLILTNRHMVHAGPVVARAVFLDNEEAELEPIYRDPVHDFGLYRFDPAEIRYLDLVELELDPASARVGMEIRVIGNDAGEKLSILDGTLARLDRNAPRYGGDTYNDFNTFYFQAASNTSGGSSGSPVIDVRGKVVALNAGGRSQAASSFYLPLDRVTRALDLIRQGRPVPRGTLATTLVHMSYEDLGRLGLSEQTERSLRTAFPKGSGMLVVKQVTPEGPAAGTLRPGDILVQIEGQLVDGFVPVEAVLDDAVGGEVELVIERLGTPQTVRLPVWDLHAITPSSFLEVGRAIVHDLSYQQARNHDLPVRGVYVASTGYMLSSAGVAEGDVILEVDGEPTPDLDALQAVLERKADRARIRVRRASVSDIRRETETIVTVDRTWNPMRRCTLEPSSGAWPCVDSPPPPPPPPPVVPDVRLEVKGDRSTRRLASSLVIVDFDVPYSTAGVAGQFFLGTGVVVDATRGLVLVDRDTVPVALGDLTLTFGGTVRVPGEVLWLHPLHNVAVVRYDPALLGDTPVAEATFSERWMSRDDEVTVVGLDREGHVVTDEAEVKDVDTLLVPSADTPRFRDTNLEVGQLAKVERSVGGLVTDKRGRVLGMWSSFFFPKSKDRYFYALPAPYLAPLVRTLREGELPQVRDPGVELAPESIANARERGLSDDWVRRYIDASEDRPSILEVVRTTGGSPAAEVLRQADLIIAVDGEPVTRTRQVESWTSRETVDLLVLRNGQEIDVTLQTREADGGGVRRVLSWGGALIHDPHPEVASLQGKAVQGAYVAWYWFGSPVARDGVRPTRRIVAVDDIPTPDLDSFLAAMQAGDPSRTVVLTLEDLDGTRMVRPVEPDLDYWPTERIEWRDGRWQRTRIAP